MQARVSPVDSASSGAIQIGKIFCECALSFICFSFASVYIEALVGEISRHAAYSERPPKISLAVRNNILNH